MITSLFRKTICSSNSVLNGIRHSMGLSTSTEMAKVLTFSQLNEKLKNPTTLLLDVREPAELKNDGVISQEAKNVPVGEVPTAFTLAGDDFKANYGFKKPATSDYIIVHCKAGVRAQNAAKSLNGSGYNNVDVYPGIMDFVENGGKLIK